MKKKPKDEQQEQEKQSEQPKLSAKATRERLEQTALSCGFTLMTEERLRQIRTGTPSVQFIPLPKSKKTKKTI